MAAQVGDKLAGCDVNEAHRVVGTPGGQPGAVRAERQAVNRAPHRDDRTGLARPGAPEANGLVVGARGQQLPVGAEGNTVDGVGVPAQDGEGGSFGDVPQADGPVFAGGREHAAIGMKSRVDRALLMAFQLGELLPASHVPEPHRPQEAAGGQQRAGRVQSSPRVSTPWCDGLGPGAHNRSGRQVPEIDAPARSTVASRRPSRLKATELMIAVWCFKSPVCRPVVALQSRVVPSQADEATCSPSGLKSTS